MALSRDQRLARLRGRVGRLTYDRVAEVIVDFILTERGFLEVDGWVYLHEDAIRDALDAINGGLVDRRTVTLAIQRLLYWELVEEVSGSRLGDGSATFPPVEGQPKISLLRFQADRYGEWSDGDGSGDGYDAETSVYGHTRKLRPGQQASEDAVRAHQEAQERGRVANNGSLPPGYTFVTEHRRKYRTESGPRPVRAWSLAEDTDPDEEDGYEQWT